MVALQRTACPVPVRSASATSGRSAWFARPVDGSDDSPSTVPSRAMTVTRACRRSASAAHASSSRAPPVQGRIVAASRASPCRRVTSVDIWSRSSVHTSHGTAVTRLPAMAASVGNRNRQAIPPVGAVRACAGLVMRVHYARDRQRGRRGPPGRGRKLAVSRPGS